MAFDALAAAAVAGATDAADVGLAAGAGAALGEAGPALGAADLGVAGADAAALGATDLAAATVPDLAAGGADLGAADLSAGGLGTDIAASDLAAGGSGVLADTGATGALGDFGVTASGDLFSGAGMGPASDFGTSFGGGDVFSGDVGAGGGAGGDLGSFGGGTQAGAGAQGAGSWAGYAPGVGETPTGGPQAFGAAAQQDTGPIVSNEGIVNTQGPNFDETFNQFTTTDQGASLPTDMATRSTAIPVQAESTTLDQAFPGASQSITGGGSIPPTPPSFSPASVPPIDSAALQPTSLFNTGGLVPNTGIEAPPADFTGATTPGATTGLTPGGFDTGIATANVAPSPQMIAGAPDFAAPGGVAPATPSGAITSSPLTPATTATTPAAAASGATDALTALRMGAAGASIVSSGLNIANALNQPSYSALQPTFYPGSTVPQQPGPVVGQYSGQTPLSNSNVAGGGGGFAQPSFVGDPFAHPSFVGNPEAAAAFSYFDNGPGGGGPGAPGSGGIAGGLAASRLANGLVAGQSADQLAAEGIISPDRATRLEGTYQGITAQYAKELGVDPRTLSPGVQRMIAAQALADTGLGGR